MTTTASRLDADRVFAATLTEHFAGREFTAGDVAVVFALRSRLWVSERLLEAGHGLNPLPGVTVGRSGERRYRVIPDSTIAGADT